MAMRCVNVPWQQMPHGMDAQLDPAYPWDVFAAPAISYSRSLANGGMVVGAAGSNTTKFDLASSEMGQGARITFGVGFDLPSAIKNAGKQTVCGVAAFWVAKTTGAGSISLKWSPGGGAGAVQVDIAADGGLTFSARTESYTYAIVALDSDCRGKVVTVAGACGRASGVRVYAAMDGEYVGTASVGDATIMRGDSLRVNRGDGFTGFTGGLLYAGYWSATGAIPDIETIAALSRFGAPFLPRRVWVPRGSAAPSLPTLSSATYKPGTLTSSGFQPRVTAS